MSILVSVPITKRNVFRSDFDEPRARLRQPPRQQATETEPARVVGVIDFLRLEREIEGLGRRGSQESMSILNRAQERLLLIVAALLQNRTAFHKFAIALVPFAETQCADVSRWTCAGH